MILISKCQLKYCHGYLAIQKPEKGVVYILNNPSLLRVDYCDISDKCFTGSIYYNNEKHILSLFISFYCDVHICCFRKYMHCVYGLSDAVKNKDRCRCLCWDSFQFFSSLSIFLLGECTLHLWGILFVSSTLYSYRLIFLFIANKICKNFLFVSKWKKIYKTCWWLWNGLSITERQIYQIRHELTHLIVPRCFV